MSVGNKFLGVALLIFTIFVVYRVAPRAAILMVIALLALAYHVCNSTRRR